MAFEDLFKVYPNKNVEGRTVAKIAYEFGRNIASEPSAGMSIGLDEHAIKRQRQMIAAMRGYIKAFNERPIPDSPYTHPNRFDIDLSEPYKQFTKDGLPINEDTEMLCQYWMMLAVNVAASQSAGLAGSLITADYERCINLVDTIEQFVNEMETRVTPDLPETAFPGAMLEVPTATVKK